MVTSEEVASSDSAEDPLQDADQPHTVESLIRQQFSKALGGARGSFETTMPTVAFVVAYSRSQNVTVAVGASMAIVLALLVVRLAMRQTPRFVLSALVATAIAAFFALRSGKAEEAFLPGMLTSAAFGVGALASVLTRWPIVGFMVAGSDPKMAQDITAWRRDPGMVLVCQRLTMVLVVLYAVRAVVMFPLYFASEVTVLGVAKVALGWPAYVGALAIMGMILVRGKTPLTTSFASAAGGPAAAVPTDSAESTGV